MQELSRDIESDVSSKRSTVNSSESDIVDRTTTQRDWFNNGIPEPSEMVDSLRVEDGGN